MASGEAGFKILQNGSRHKNHSTLYPNALCIPAHTKECYFLTVFLHFETSNPLANTSLSILQSLLLSAFENGNLLVPSPSMPSLPEAWIELSGQTSLLHCYQYYLLTRIFLLSSYLSLFNHCHSSLWFTFIFLDTFCTHLLSFFLIHFLQLKT